MLVETFEYAMWVGILKLPPQHTVCKFKKFPPGNLFYASTVEKFQILEYRKVAILPQGTGTTLI